MGCWFWREAVVVCGLALLVGGGYWQGRQTGRWHPLPTTQALDFSAIPREMLDWTSTDFPLDEQETKIGGIDGYLARHYEHRGTGEVITVLILTGAGGPMSVNPPEVCFARQGYRKESKAVEVFLPSTAGSPENRFDLAVFRGPNSVEGRRVQLLWGWTNSGIWSVPANPRLAFARMPRLYKIYVSRSLRPDQDRLDSGLCLELMKTLLPEIQRRLSRGDPVADGQIGFEPPWAYSFLSNGVHSS